MTVDEVLAEVQRDRVFYQHSGGGMTLSGGEPLVTAEFRAGAPDGCSRPGLNTAVETAGQEPPGELRRVLAPRT